MDRKGAKLLTAPCVMGPLDGEQMDLKRGPEFKVRERERDYRYLRHQIAGEHSKLDFYTLDTISVDHALSYLLRGYKGSAHVAEAAPSQ